MNWIWTPKSIVTCYEILHAGDGDRGESVEILGTVTSGERAAGDASDYFDDWEKRKQRLSDSDLDGTSRVVEVVGVYDVPVRYRVRCRTKRQYDAEQVD